MLNSQTGQITRGAFLIHSKTTSVARSLGTRMSNRWWLNQHILHQNA